MSFTRVHSINLNVEKLKHFLVNFAAFLFANWNPETFCKIHFSESSQTAILCRIYFCELGLNPQN